MDGKKSSMAVGIKPITINGKEYDTKLNIGDTRAYVKNLQRKGLELKYYSTKEDIEKVLKIADEIVDYKYDFVKKALINGGMSNEEADALIDESIQDVVGDGKIEVWLGFISKKDYESATNLKN